MSADIWACQDSGERVLLASSAPPPRHRDSLHLPKVQVLPSHALLCDLWQVARLLCASPAVWVTLAPFLLGPVNSEAACGKHSAQSTTREEFPCFQSRDARRSWDGGGGSSLSISWSLAMPGKRAGPCPCHRCANRSSEGNQCLESHSRTHTRICPRLGLRQLLRRQQPRGRGPRRRRRPSGAACTSHLIRRRRQLLPALRRGQVGGCWEDRSWSGDQEGRGTWAGISHPSARCAIGGHSLKGQECPSCPARDSKR